MKKQGTERRRRGFSIKGSSLSFGVEEKQ